MRRSLVRVLLVVVVVFATQTSATAQTICGSQSCLYVPFVARTTPIWVTSFSGPTLCIFRDPFATSSCAGGEFFNGLQQPVSEVVLRIRFFDNQQRQEIVTRTISFPAMFPNQTYPFNTATISQSYPFAEASVVGWTVLTETLYQPLTVVMTETVYDSSFPRLEVKFIAKLRNDQSKTLTDVRALVWVKDDERLTGNGLSIPIEAGQTRALDTFLPNRYFDLPIKIVAVGRVQSP